VSARRAATWAVLVAALFGAAALGLRAATAAPGVDAGVVPAAPSASVIAVPPPITAAPMTSAPRSTSGPVAGEPPAPEPVPQATVREGLISDLDPLAAPVAPTRLVVPALDVDAPVDEIGLIPGSDRLEIPAEVATAGWYGFGAGLDAAIGSVVVAGHVDDYRQGTGVFHDLWRVPLGATVSVTGDDGRVRRYEVVARRRYDKEELPAEVFAADVDRRLVLVTCGGEFDELTRHYEDNVVVYAVPVPLGAR
jgi:Sortase domain